MIVAVFDTHRFDREALETENLKHSRELRFFETRLSSKTATLAAGCRAVCPLCQ